MRHSVTIFAVVCMMLVTTGLQAAVITSVDRTNGHPSTPGQPDIVPGPSPDGLQVGSQAFLDRWDLPSGRRYHWEAIPAELVGADYVKTYNNDKQIAAQNVSYSVTVSQFVFQLPVFGQGMLVLMTLLSTVILAAIPFAFPAVVNWRS